MTTPGTKAATAERLTKERDEAIAARAETERRQLRRITKKSADALLGEMMRRYIKSKRLKLEIIER